MVRISQAAAVVALSVPAVFADVRLFARQLPGLDPSTIPQACQDKCTSFTASIQGNPGCFTDIKCLCDPKLATGLADCVKCGYDAVPDAFNGTTPDALIKQYSDGCAAAGSPVTVGGGSGSASGSAAGSATKSATGAASTGKATGTATSPAGGATGATTSGSAGGASPSPGSASAATVNALGVVAAIAAGAAAFL